MGSRDCLDAIRLHETFNVRVISFEPDSKAFRICEANLQKFGKLQNQISAHPIALGETNGHIVLFDFDLVMEAFSNLST